MSNILKLKILFIVISTLLLVFIALRRNNFYKTPSYKKWSTLNWDDFQGMHPPFTKYEAGIDRKLVLEFDSIQNKYVCYAIMNDQRSWRKLPDTTNYNNLLKHEQYHFNITEIFSRKMNAYIKNNPSSSLEDYKESLDDFEVEENQMQTKYDEQSNHSLEEAYQNVWEYKVDYMLRSFESEPFYVIQDSLSGVQASFPDSPIFTTEHDSIDEYTGRYYYANKYNALFFLASYEYGVKMDLSAEERLREHHEVDGDEIVSITNKISSNEDQAYSISIDSTKSQITELKWVDSPSYSYQIAAKFPSEYKDVKEYRQMIKSFMDSFKVSEID